MPVEILNGMWKYPLRFCCSDTIIEICIKIQVLDVAEEDKDIVQADRLGMKRKKVSSIRQHCFLIKWHNRVMEEDSHH